MIRKITLILCLLVFGMAGFAQINFEKDTVPKIYVDQASFDYSSKNQLTNSSVDAKDTLFTWTRVLEDIPATWETAICDQTTCYPPELSTKDLILKQGDFFDFKVNFYPYNTAGCGKAKIVIQSKVNPSNKDSFYTEVCSFDAAASVKDVKTTVNLYPNPAKDFIVVNTSITGLYTVNIYDILGVLKLSKGISSGNSLDIKTLGKGVYILRIEGDANATKVFQKQ
ncbi:MAG: T9SS type A sorting domain-containing protein [Bacteroidia bacterium]|nr:T9SS type A sorting domain-containing protein [Bacteroidia bacterium]NNJ55275.1 T9SS type A sorting domain-containing protein [Bacteroidia bacterium]